MRRSLGTLLALSTLVFSVPPEGSGESTATADGLKYIRIPAGTFRMGCVPGDRRCFNWEKPRHSVTLSKPFWMAQTPVTVAAYKKFAAAAHHPMPDAPAFNPAWSKESDPIVNVSWDDAATYCSWAGGRLPTDAEWEYAARGGKSGLRYPWGNRVPTARPKASNGARFDKSWSEGTISVGTYHVNGFGLYDMAGNVWQWCADWHSESSYTEAPARDPKGPASGSRRALRGGSWYSTPWDLRASYRNHDVPGVRDVSVGFRCVRDAS